MDFLFGRMGAWVTRSERQRPKSRNAKDMLCTTVKKSTIVYTHQMTTGGQLIFGPKDLR